MSSIITPVAVLSYPYLEHPQAAEADETGKMKEPKFSATLIFLAGADLGALKSVCVAAAKETWTGKAEALIKTGALRFPFRTDWEAKGYPEGSTFINARSNRRPGMVYAHAAPGKSTPMPVDEKDIVDVFYPGAVVRASLNVFSYDVKGNKGVSFALVNLQKLSEGERLDGRKAAADEFDVQASAPMDADPLAGLTGAGNAALASFI